MRQHALMLLLACTGVIVLDGLCMHDCFRFILFHPPIYVVYLSICVVPSIHDCCVMVMHFCPLQLLFYMHVVCIIL